MIYISFREEIEGLRAAFRDYHKALIAYIDAKAEDRATHATPTRPKESRDE